MTKDRLAVGNAREAASCGRPAIDLHGEDKQNTKGLSILPRSAGEAYVLGTSRRRPCDSIWLDRSMLAYRGDGDGKG
jgi:hypothetical protein